MVKIGGIAESVESVAESVAFESFFSRGFLPYVQDGAQRNCVCMDAQSANSSALSISFVGQF